MNIAKISAVQRALLYLAFTKRCEIEVTMLVLFIGKKNYRSK